MKLSTLFTTAAFFAFSMPVLAAPEAPAAKAENAAPAAEAPAQKDYVILKVGGQPIMNSEVEDMWKGLFRGGPAPDFATFDESVRENVLRGVASERLLYKEAVNAGYDKSEDVQKRLENLRRQLIIQAYAEDKAKNLVTDDALKQAYDAKVASLKGQEEVHARHILVKTEDEAKAIESQLKKGGDFAKIAKEKSIDKSSGAVGGDLGYFTKDRMVPQFSEAAFKLKKGEVSAPVKSDFGWHIIQVVDRRPSPVPTFDEMKESLRAEVQNQAMQNYVEGLLKKADIKYYTPGGEEKVLSREFAAPDLKADPALPSPTPAR